MPCAPAISQNILATSARTEAEQWSTSVPTMATAACWHRVGTRVSPRVRSSCRLSREAYRALSFATRTVMWSRWRAVSSARPGLCFYSAARHLLLFCYVAKDMCHRKEVAALGKQALKVTLGTWGYWREPEGKSCGPWPVWKSMLRALLWQVAEKGRPISPQILNVERLLGPEVARSLAVPAAAGVIGDFKTVEQQDPMLESQIITVNAAHANCTLFCASNAQKGTGSQQGKKTIFFGFLMNVVRGVVK